MSTCFRRKEAKAPSRAPVISANAMSARSRFSIGVKAGMTASTFLISSRLGHTLFPAGTRDPRILVGRIEIICVIGIDGRAETGLAGEPQENVAQMLQGGRDG